VRSYIPRVYPGSMVLFRAMEQSPGSHPDPFLGWGDLVEGGVETHDVPGLHGEIIAEPHVRILAGKLKDCLEKLQSVTATPEAGPTQVSTGINQSEVSSQSLSA